MNRPPLPPAVIPDQTATEGVSFGYTAAAFTDADGDPLTYAFSGLPSWLTVCYPAINTRYVCGRPPYSEATPGNPATYTITLRATDPAGAAADKSFGLSVFDAVP